MYHDILSNSLANFFVLEAAKQNFEIGAVNLAFQNNIL